MKKTDRFLIKTLKKKNHKNKKIKIKIKINNKSHTIDIVIIAWEIKRYL